MFHLKWSWCVFVGFVLCCLSVVISSSNYSESVELENLKVNQNQNPKVAQAPEIQVSLVLERLDALEKRLLEEMSLQFKSSEKNWNDQFKSLKKQLEDMKNENSVGEDVWLLTPPLRGRRGQKGEKGDSSGVPTTAKPGSKGERETLAVDLKSIRSCSDALKMLPSPLFKKQTIYPHDNNKNRSVEVLCDFETYGGGWTIIQKRTSGPKNEFNRNWTEYSNGFGSLDENGTGNFWLGLENIHALTKNGDQELRIELKDFEGQKTWAQYSSFSISDAADFYELAIDGYFTASTAGDSMANPNYGSNWNLNGMRFSTRDQDNDNWKEGNCVVTFSTSYYGGDAGGGGGGGWWYNRCSASNLNGLYFEKGETVPKSRGIYWNTWKGKEYSLAKTEMKIRPRK